MKREWLRAGLIFGGGDLIACLITGTWAPWRWLGLSLTGGLIYAPEIRWYFDWLERRLPPPLALRRRWLKAVLAWCWFNPLWIARHALLIRLYSGRWAEIDPWLLMLGARAFVFSMPVVLCANYLIQNRLQPASRVTGSAVLSALMAFYYALSEVWFG